MRQRRQPPPVPASEQTVIARENEMVRLHPSEGTECDRAEGDDQTWIDQLDLPAQMIRTVGDLSAAGPAIDAPVVRTRIAEDSVGDENVASPPTGGSQQTVESLAGAISVERSSGSITAEPSRRLSDEHDERPGRAVGRREHSSAPFHGRAPAAAGDLGAERVEHVALIVKQPD